MPTLIPRILSGRPGAVARHKQIESFQDLRGVRIESIDGTPFPLQLDGDYIGEFDRIEFSVEPAGLSVVS
jgi:diacylglycerol kinase family enzyme